MKSQDQPRQDWTVVLRRRPVRMVEGRPEGGWADKSEIVCCACGDDPDLDYRDVSRALQRIHGPYPIAAASRPTSGTPGGTPVRRDSGQRAIRQIEELGFKHDQAATAEAGTSPGRYART